jgi:hypothetical protein
MESRGPLIGTALRELDSARVPTAVCHSITLSEEDLGSGDIHSLQEQPSMEDGEPFD